MASLTSLAKTALTLVAFNIPRSLTHWSCRHSIILPLSLINTEVNPATQIHLLKRIIMGVGVVGIWQKCGQAAQTRTLFKTQLNLLPCLKTECQFLPNCKHMYCFVLTVQLLWCNSTEHNALISGNPGRVNPGTYVGMVRDLLTFVDNF